MTDTRQARYAEAIHRVWCTPSCVSPVRHASRLSSEASAVMSVADKELHEHGREVRETMRQVYAADRVALNARLAELEAACQRLRDDYQGALAERDALAQAMWTARGVLGFDNDGDPSPGASIAGMGYQWFAEEHVKEAKEQRKDYEDLLDLWDGTERREWVARAEAAEADAAGLRARMLRLADARDVKYPAKFAFGAAENHVAGYRAAQADFRAALAAEPTPAAEPHAEDGA